MVLERWARLMINVGIKSKKCSILHSIFSLSMLIGVIVLFSSIVQSVFTIENKIFSTLISTTLIFASVIALLMDASSYKKEGYKELKRKCDNIIIDLRTFRVEIEQANTNKKLEYCWEKITSFEKDLSDTDLFIRIISNKKLEKKFLEHSQDKQFIEHILNK